MKLLPLALTLAGLLLAARGATAQKSCTAAGCHENILKGKSIHAAAESCDTCHEAATPGAPHPQKGKKTFKSTAKLPDLCSNCHEAFGKKPVVHAPVKDGSCRTCHDPHASKEPKLLTSPPKDLCGACHSTSYPESRDCPLVLLHQPPRVCLVCGRASGAPASIPTQRAIAWFASAGVAVLPSRCPASGTAHRNATPMRAGRAICTRHSRPAWVHLYRIGSNKIAPGV